MTIKTVNVHGGHNKIVTGASSYLNEVAEDRKVKNYLIGYLRDAGLVVYDCTDEDGDEKYKNLANIVKKCNMHKVDIDVSLHLNAHKKTSKPMGVETWNFSSKTKEISDRINKNISKALGIPNRGTKYSKDLYVLRNTKSKALLIECAFVDSKYDADKWDAKLVAKAIAEAVINGEIKEDVKPHKPSKPAEKPNTVKKSIATVAKEVIDGKWGNGEARKKKLKAAGYDCSKVQEKVNEILNSKTSKTDYYKKCSSSKASLVDGLKEVGADSSFNNRSKIAKKNGFKTYAGTAKQNNKLLDLLKKGKLRK